MQGFHIYPAPRHKSNADMPLGEGGWREKEVGGGERERDDLKATAGLWGLQ